jgi:hypothetical protein
VHSTTENGSYALVDCTRSRVHSSRFCAVSTCALPISEDLNAQTGGASPRYRSRTRRAAPTFVPPFAASVSVVGDDAVSCSGVPPSDESSRNAGKERPGRAGSGDCAEFRRNMLLNLDFAPLPAPPPVGTAESIAKERRSGGEERRRRGCARAILSCSRCRRSAFPCCSTRSGERAAAATASCGEVVDRVEVTAARDGGADAFRLCEMKDARSFTDISWWCVEGRAARLDGSRTGAFTYFFARKCLLAGSMVNFLRGVKRKHLRPEPPRSCLLSGRISQFSAQPGARPLSEDLADARVWI